MDSWEFKVSEVETFWVRTKPGWGRGNNGSDAGDRWNELFQEVTLAGNRYKCKEAWTRARGQGLKWLQREAWDMNLRADLGLDKCPALRSTPAPTTSWDFWPGVYPPRADSAMGFERYKHSCEDGAQLHTWLLVNLRLTELMGACHGPSLHAVS